MAHSFRSDNFVVAAPLVPANPCAYGDHRRVISGRHLSKHGIDRETYMEEYALSPDELIAKDVRRLQSSRRDYRPYGKRDWIQAIRELHKVEGNIFAGRLQKKHSHLYVQGTWLFGDWDNALGFDPEKMRRRRFWDQKFLIEKIRALRRRNVPLSANYAMKNHQGAFDAALREYGSWSRRLWLRA